MKAAEAKSIAENQVLADFWKHYDKVMDETSYVELKNLSDITDEQAIEVEKILGHKVFVGIKFIERFIADAFFDNPFSICIAVIDYLRSKGYALPAFGYTVDQLIEENIFKIKEK